MLTWGTSIGAQKTGQQQKGEKKKLDSELDSELDCVLDCELPQWVARLDATRENRPVETRVEPQIVPNVHTTWPNGRSPKPGRRKKSSILDVKAQ